MHHRSTHPGQPTLTQPNDVQRLDQPSRPQDRVATASEKIDGRHPTPWRSRPGGPTGYPTQAQTPRSRSSKTSMLRIAIVAAAILTLGVGANVADTTEIPRSTLCVRRLLVGHVPGRLDKVWVIPCIPTRTTINRD
jgi:hypothetical protein